MNELFINKRKTTAYNGPPLDTVSGGNNVHCSEGHYNATLTRGYDPKKNDYYLRAWCLTCKSGQKLYDKERKEHEL